MVGFFSYVPVKAAISLLLLLFIYLQPCSIGAARTTPDDPLTESATRTLNTTWHDFSKFLDAGKGSQVPGMAELKVYFRRFGYLPKEVENTTFSDEFDEELETAIFEYQKKLGLQSNGKLGKDTVEAIMAPRCGMPDDLLPAGDSSKLHTTQHFSYFHGKPRWFHRSPINLSYAFSPEDTIDYFTSRQLKAAFSAAFSKWAAVIPVDFYLIDEYESADIKIGFFKGDHGDKEPFDGVLGIVGHAFSPENGRFHLDAAERWAVDFDSEKTKTAIDLESVATHEIGHVLGLAHSSVRDAIMYPSLSLRTKKVDLRIDDVEGVQALYGSNPNFKMSSLYESDVYSSGAMSATFFFFSGHSYNNVLFLLLIWMTM